MKKTLSILTAALSAAPLALAQMPTARVGDVTRLQGQGTNVLTGYGLVTGLAGTGDGGNFTPTMKALASHMERFGAGIESITDVESAKNVAVVTVEVTIPEHGAREGGLLDVRVAALAAKSLAGGRLLPTPLIYHDRNVEGLFGFASGGIVVEEETPTSGLIRGGARMERDVLMNVIGSGTQLRAAGFTNPWIDGGSHYITLVLDDAHTGWSMAAAIAQAVDKELSVAANVERVALAADSRNVIVLLPPHQIGDPASWIRDVERTPILMESNEALVTINRSGGTIVVSGDTKLSPVVISQRGLTVTVANPLPDGTEIPPPALEEQDWVPLDAERSRQANVRDLLEALNRLKLPFEDRVSIIEQVHRAGKLHARILYEN